MADPIRYKGYDDNRGAHAYHLTPEGIALVQEARETMQIEGVLIDESLTFDRVLDALEESIDSPGFCANCGEEAEPCDDPDCRDPQCAHCGEETVYGAYELLLCLS